MGGPHEGGQEHPRPPRGTGVTPQGPLIHPGERQAQVVGLMAQAHWEASSRQRLANLIKLGALQVLSEPELQKFSFLNLKEAPSEPQTEETKSVRAGPG